MKELELKYPVQMVEFMMAHREELDIKHREAIKKEERIIPFYEFVKSVYCKYN